MESEAHRRREFAHSNNPTFACAPAVIVIPFGRRSYLEEAATIYRGERVPLDETTDRIVYQLTGLSHPVTLLYSGMGGPAVANALEMARGNGAQRVVVVGACGGVDPAVEIGQLIVAAAAVRGEGTSRYYAAPDFPAACDPHLTHRLWRSARDFAGGAHCGVVFTTDASYRQGPEVYDAHEGMLLGVESECATAAVVARRVGLALGAVLFCSDNVTAAARHDRGYRGLAEPRIRAGFTAALKAAATALTESAPQ